MFLAALAQVDLKKGLARLSNLVICESLGLTHISSSKHCLSEIEVLAIIFAAAIHDYEHTGTTNSFHIQTK